MAEPRVRTRIKVALAALPARYSLPSKPSAAPPIVQDAFRQTQFLLGNDLLLFERGMNLQLVIAGADPKPRTPSATALLPFWSRTFSHLADAVSLMTIGSYSSCAPLLRSALDCLAVQRSLLRDGFDEYEEWLGCAISQDREHAALVFDLGRYRAASVLAEDESLGPLYRLLTDLSMPHFGSTAFLTGSDSNLQKLSLSFGDSTFHMGWAELIMGWLLTLCEAQVHTAASSGPAEAADAARTGIADLGRDIRLALNGSRRCYVEEAEGRFLFHNFRRKSGGVPRRLMI